MTARLVGTPQQTITYDRTLGRYRSGDGKFVSRSTLLRIVDEEAARLSARMQGHARLLTQGQIDLPQFQRRAAEDLKLSHVRMGILASGGRSLATSQIYGTVGRSLRSQYEYLDGFARDLEKGKLTAKQAIARAGMYGASTRAAFHQNEKIAKGREGFRLAKRLLDTNKNHCEDCLRHSTGDRFVPIEQITSPGVDCLCRARCRCFLVWKKN